MIINSTDYFNSKINWKKDYEIIVVKDSKKREEMISYFQKFIDLKDETKNLGLDFEFNKSDEGKKIALFQINLETSSNLAKIYLFYPPDLSKKQLNTLINLLIDNS